ncbi:hypothetical protein ACIOD2_41850 [Amycolatopsis sp. NPDC088138]|uniref:DUF7660 family protein n=1 Tax=Amycolatopsis sp. NPDC088138 TaxID=3363938 RepID=UPI003822E0E1
MQLSPEDRIENREAFAAFLRAFHEDFLRRGQEWENPTLDRFLEALAAWAAGSDGWYRTFGQDLPPDGDWTFFARALTAATVYE